MTFAPLDALAPLIGTWKGEGHGAYPTITAFDYVEEITFADVGKPFLVYHQRTWNTQGKPMHVEMGYLRAPGPGQVEITMALPTGQTEIGAGTLEPDPFTLLIDCRVDSTPSAKPVIASRRELRIQGAQLVTGYAMAAMGLDLQPHLASRLTRQG
ncbi:MULTISPECIES: FABP family protein [unclassified Luteococcus]|uniref:FABP family protein n=1 Tax=unclassified Luteococcus TaxID=2639923 RepID=UPI00313BCE0C